MKNVLYTKFRGVCYGNKMVEMPEVWKPALHKICKGNENI